MPHSRFTSLRSAAAALVVLFALASCAAGGSNGVNGVGSAQGSPSGSASGELVVFAAASLTEAFNRIAEDFEAANPDVNLEFNFAGSSSLARQLIRGAPADVYASANEEQMQRVIETGLAAGQLTVFVRNTLQIVVPAGNPAGVAGLAAFGKDELDIAICAEEVPCGAASQQAFQVAGITPAPDTLEQDVKAVLTKASLGEVDAGLVYRTDVASATGDVEGISFPEADQAINDYPIVVTDAAPNASAAQAFVDYMRSPKGQQVLADFGFTTVDS